MCGYISNIISKDAGMEYGDHDKYALGVLWVGPAYDEAFGASIGCRSGMVKVSPACECSLVTQGCNA
jgi:hypothetical protein